MEGGRSVAEFCSTEVEPMYRESDHIHIIGEFEMVKVIKIILGLIVRLDCGHRNQDQSDLS